MLPPGCSDFIFDYKILPAMLINVALKRIGDMLIG